MGVIHVVGAWLADRLIGFISILAPDLPHYGCPVAVSESFFVAADARAAGYPGLRLLATAETWAKELGSPVLYVSAPFAGKLCKVLDWAGYEPVNTIYGKIL